MKIAEVFLGLVALFSTSIGDTGENSHLNPIIEADGEKVDGSVRVRLGGQLTIKCSIINAATLLGPYVLNWIYPSSFDGNGMSTSYESFSKNFLTNATRRVTLKNIKESTVGLWSCTVRSPQETKTASLTLVVDEPEEETAAGSAVRLECGAVLLLSAWILYQSCEYL